VRFGVAAGEEAGDGSASAERFAESAAPAVVASG